MMPEAVLIVGGGVAGGQAAQTLRASGYDGRLVLVGDEPDRPYERPPLSKELLLGRMERAMVFLRPDAWYEEQAVELRLGVRVTQLEASGRAELDSGETIAFDACLLATGGRPRRLPVPGADRPGILTLRTLPDADALASALDAGARVVVVGAGFIGAEVAAAARARGCAVTMLEVAPLPLGRVLAPDLGALYRDLHAAHGVDVRLQEGVDRYEGSERVEAVVGTSGRRYPADIVVVGVGIDPADELARAAGLPCDNGVIVDEHCRTAAPTIYAAGDVARHPNPWAAGLVRVEHLQNAQRQGAAAARAMLGSEEPYAELHWFWSDQYDVNLQMLGHPSPDDATITRGRPQDRDCVRFSIRSGRVVSAIGLNRGRDVSVARRLIERRVEVDATMLADEDVSLADLLRR